MTLEAPPQPKRNLGADWWWGATVGLPLGLLYALFFYFGVGSPNQNAYNDPFPGLALYGVLIFLLFFVVGILCGWDTGRVERGVRICLIASFLEALIVLTLNSVLSLVVSTSFQYLFGYADDSRVAGVLWGLGGAGLILCQMWVGVGGTRLGGRLGNHFLRLRPRLAALLENRSAFRGIVTGLIIMELGGVGLGMFGLAGIGPLFFLKTPISEFALPTPHSAPSAITSGPDGALWFTEEQANQIGRLTPGGNITEFRVPTPQSDPTAITAGPDGNLWFTEKQGNRIGRITPGGAITEFPVPTPQSGLTSITVGPDGNLWFTEGDPLYGNKIGRITTNGTITEFTLPTPYAGPSAITAGPEDSLWFAESNRDQIGRITPEGIITEFRLDPSYYGNGPSGIAAMAAGPDGNLWVTQDIGSVIMRITPSGTVTVFYLNFEYPPADPGGITTGPDGNLWFTDQENSKIGQITPDGSITLFPVPTAQSDPFGVTAGSDGNLWFTEFTSNKVGRMWSNRLGLLLTTD